MFRQIWAREEAVFPTELPIGEAVEKLRGELVDSKFGFGFNEGVAGSVAQDKVRLSWYWPLKQNSARVFRGSFVKDERGVVLEGSFSIDRIGQIWMSFFVGSCFVVPFVLFFIMTFELGGGIYSGMLALFGAQLVSSLFFLCARWMLSSDLFFPNNVETISDYIRKGLRAGSD